MNKRGAKSLPLDRKLVASFNSRMDILHLTASEICRRLSNEISVSSLGAKLRGEVGWHDEEVEAVQRVIDQEEQRIRQLLAI